MTIRLGDIWPIENPKNFKVHFARWNGKDEPLDVWARDRRAWQDWQEHRPKRGDFNRPCIFSLMRFYYEPDVWLFGGVFRVLARRPDGYEVKLVEQGEGFIGRLKLRSPYQSRNPRAKMENHFGNFEVREILREPWSGRSFPGYENIDLPFGELETLTRNDRPDWKAALESVKGVYLITDARAGKRYVGSACGDQGIWSRWRAYAETGHGGSADLRRWIRKRGMDSWRVNSRFALLEHFSGLAADELVLAREEYWKDVLTTRGKRGLNRN